MAHQRKSQCKQMLDSEVMKSKRINAENENLGKILHARAVGNATEQLTEIRDEVHSMRKEIASQSHDFDVTQQRFQVQCQRLHEDQVEFGEKCHEDISKLTAMLLKTCGGVMDFAQQVLEVLCFFCKYSPVKQRSQLMERAAAAIAQRDEAEEALEEQLSNFENERLIWAQKVGLASFDALSPF